MTAQFNRQPKAGFTIIELLVVFAIVLIIASLSLTSASNAKKRSLRIACVNNLKQINLATSLYVDDSEDEYPRRAASSRSNWVALLSEYYVNSNLLICPNDPKPVGRSYLINGFNDWFKANLSAEQYLEFEMWRWPRGMSGAALPNPSEVILFGEKLRTSSHVHMDLLQSGGNDLYEIDHGRHAGGANFAFADGHVTWHPFWGSVSPLNLWSTTPEWRVVSVPKSP